MPSQCESTGQGWPGPCRVGLVLSVIMALGAPAVAGIGDVPKDRFAQFKMQSKMIDRRAAMRSGEAPQVTKARASVPAYRGKYRGQYLKMAESAAKRHGIPVSLFHRLVQQESGWNPVAKSSKGAQGLAQLMPDTAQLLGVDAADPAQNLDGGARYLRQQYDRFKDWRLALAAYNAGPGAVERHGGIPPYKETQGYVKAILGE